MTHLLCLASPTGEPPPVWIFLVLFPVIFFGASMFSSRLMGIFDLYRAFPPDRSDPIETNLGWIQIEFGLWRGHTPMSVKAGRRCLHLKQPFPFQLLYWRGPASIPWDQIRVTGPTNEHWWAFWAPTEFFLGSYERPIRIRGKAARKLQAHMKDPRGLTGTAVSPSIQPH